MNSLKQSLTFESLISVEDEDNLEPDQNQELMPSNKIKVDVQLSTSNSKLELEKDDKIRPIVSINNRAQTHQGSRKRVVINMAGTKWAANQKRIKDKQ